MHVSRCFCDLWFLCDRFLPDSRMCIETYSMDYSLERKTKKKKKRSLKSTLEINHHFVEELNFEPKKETKSPEKIDKKANYNGFSTCAYNSINIKSVSLDQNVTSGSETEAVNKKTKKKKRQHEEIEEAKDTIDNEFVVPKKMGRKKKQIVEDLAPDIIQTKASSNSRRSSFSSSFCSEDDRYCSGLAKDLKDYGEKAVDIVSLTELNSFLEENSSTPKKPKINLLSDVSLTSAEEIDSVDAISSSPKSKNLILKPEIHIKKYDEENEREEDFTMKKKKTKHKRQLFTMEEENIVPKKKKRKENVEEQLELNGTIEDFEKKKRQQKLTQTKINSWFNSTIIDALYEDVKNSNPKKEKQKLHDQVEAEINKETLAKTGSLSNSTGGSTYKEVNNFTSKKKKKKLEEAEVFQHDQLEAEINNEKSHANIDSLSSSTVDATYKEVDNLTPKKKKKKKKLEEAQVFEHDQLEPEINKETDAKIDSFSNSTVDSTYKEVDSFTSKKKKKKEKFEEAEVFEHDELEAEIINKKTHAKNDNLSNSTVDATYKEVNSFNSKKKKKKLEEAQVFEHDQLEPEINKGTDAKIESFSNSTVDRTYKEVDNFSSKKKKKKKKLEKAEVFEHDQLEAEINNEETHAKIDSLSISTVDATYKNVDNFSPKKKKKKKKKKPEEAEIFQHDQLKAEINNEKSHANIGSLSSSTVDAKYKEVDNLTLKEKKKKKKLEEAEVVEHDQLEAEINHEETQAKIDSLYSSTIDAANKDVDNFSPKKKKKKKKLEEVKVLEHDELEAEINNKETHVNDSLLNSTCKDVDNSTPTKTRKKKKLEEAEALEHDELEAEMNSKETHAKIDSLLNSTIDTLKNKKEHDAPEEKPKDKEEGTTIDYLCNSTINFVDEELQNSKHEKKRHKETENLVQEQNKEGDRTTEDLFSLKEKEKVLSDDSGLTDLKSSTKCDSSKTKKNGKCEEMKKEIGSPGKKRTSSESKHNIKKEVGSPMKELNSAIVTEEKKNRRISLDRRKSITMYTVKKKFSKIDFDIENLEKKIVAHKKRHAGLNNDPDTCKPLSTSCPAAECRDKPIEEILDELKKEPPSEEEDYLDKLRYLQVIVPNTIPLHLIETRVSNRPREDQKKQIEALGVRVKSGKFTKLEDEAIMKNFKEFCKLHDLRHDPAPFLDFTKVETAIPPGERIKFVRFLAQGLSDRLLNAVYKRFQRLSFGAHRRSGRFSAEEDQILIDYMRETKSVTPYADLAKVLNRDKLSVERRVRLLTELITNKGPVKVFWNRSLIECFMKHLVDVTQVEEVEDLKHRTITKEEWEEMSRRMGISVHKLKSAWGLRIYIHIFIENTVSSNEIKERLVETLMRKGINDWRDVDWEEIALEFEGFTPIKLCTIMRILANHYVPVEKRNDLGACLIESKEFMRLNKLKGMKIRKYQVVDQR